jgi:hypothetical protein
MRRTKPHAWAAAAVVGLWLFCAAVTPAAAQSPAQKCGYIDFRHPETRTYRVREVRIESKIDFLHAISNYLKEVKSELPLQSEHEYPLVTIITGTSQGRALIERELDKATKDSDPRSRLRVVRGGLENCDRVTGQLDVVYRIFLTNYDDYLSHTWELKSKELKEPGNAAAEPNADLAKGFLTVKPIVGYDRTVRGFGGGLLRLKMPGGLFETGEVSAVGSPTSNKEALELAGSRRPGLAALNELNYRVSYKHSDEPAGANRLRQGTLSFQAFGASRPLGKYDVIVRYGTSIEGGNQHTDLDAVAAAGDSSADSGYGGLKAYVGTTMRLGRVALTGSYGIQLGTRGASTDLDFVKHLGDFALTTQFWKTEGRPGKVNKALTIEARLTGGTIQSHGRIPVAQRFFGGNAQTNFIDGDNWMILSEPFIRSIPRNRLNSAGDIGGTRFYSANFTVGREVWGYPLMPKELKQEPGFVDTILPGTLTSTRTVLRRLYLVKVPEYVEFVENIPSFKVTGDTTLKLWLEALAERLAKLPDRFPDTLEQKQRDDFEDIATDARDNLVLITSQFEEAEKPNLPSKLDDLLIDEGDCKPTPSLSCSLATTVRFRLEDLAVLLDSAHMQTDAAVARADAATILQAQKDIKVRINGDPSSGVKGIDLSLADKMADDDTKVVKAALDAFVKELNVVAVSPVAVFDVARVWPDPAGTRYGAGCGVRLSIFNFNTTVGYAFNLKHHAGDGRGAFFFSMDFTDIFR